MDYRIAMLSQQDDAYENGARWALMAPVWDGFEVDVKAIKTATLTDAITYAEKGRSLLCSIAAVKLMGSPPHGQPMTVEKAAKWIAHVRDCAEHGNKNAIADLGIL